MLKAYIAEWGKFFTQCDYLPKPFGQLETTLAGKAHSTMQKKTQGEESIVRKVEIVHFMRFVALSQMEHRPTIHVRTFCDYILNLLVADVG